MASKLGIYTAGGLARAIASHFDYVYETDCFIDAPRSPGEQIRGVPVTLQPDLRIDRNYVIGCGEPDRRRVIAEANNVRWVTLVHKNSNVSKYACIGEGGIICPGVGIDPDVKIGNHVYVDYNAVIGHDAEIGDYTVIGPLVLVAGGCKVGEAAYIGTGAKIVKKAKIGEEAVIGAGAVVLKDVPPRTTWAGVPARQIR